MSHGPRSETVKALLGPLNAYYRDVKQRPVLYVDSRFVGVVPGFDGNVYLDVEAIIVWQDVYLGHRDDGKSYDAAVDLMMRDVAGLPLQPPTAFDIRLMRADRLTLSTDGRCPKGKYGYSPTDSYPHMTQGAQAGMRDAVLSHRHNAIYISPVLEGGNHLGPNYPTGDLLDKPHLFRVFCTELLAAGIWPIVQCGLEDAPNAQAKYGLDGFKRHTAALALACRDVVGAYLIGPESTEWIGRMTGNATDSAEAFEELHHVGAYILEQTGVKFGAHLTKELWGPKGGEARWLREATWCSALHYQYGFGHSYAYIRRETIKMRQLVEDCGILFVGNEYSLDDEQESLRLGAEIAALGVPFANGGPGQEP